MFIDQKGRRLEHRLREHESAARYKNIKKFKFAEHLGLKGITVLGMTYLSLTFIEKGEY